MVERIPITAVGPVVERGQHPVKAVVGETVRVEATVFREGHDALGAAVVPTDPAGDDRPPVLMTELAGIPDRYAADITPDAAGPWTFRVESWSNPYASWRHAAEIKIAADIDTELMFLEGAIVLERAFASLPKDPAGEAAADTLAAALTAARDSSRPVPVRLAALTSPDVDAVLAEFPLRELVCKQGPFPLYVDRERALVGSWYEFFPRSEGASYDDSTQMWASGTFATAATRLQAVADMGFDVIYLPPIHPIGEVNRKGPNNTLTPGPRDPGSPWAIGSKDGGHDAIHPDLGTMADFDAFVAEASRLGLEVALDLALQCAPDHPWVSTHPEWFTTRADGSIAYAENPPKKYQDIYPMSFDNDFEGVSREVLRVVRLWMDHGVRIFRVDNPHTKPVPFWQWLLGEIRGTDPDVIFLAEAFTRPAMMRALAMVGFHQSYTYFTWRNTKWEVETYLDELSHDTSDVMRPNLFVNTPDILTEYLQYGGPAAFRVRASLAALGAPTWGVYAGFELFEHVAVKPGSEEYLNSEKYEYRPRDWGAADREGRTLAPYLTRLNEIRRRHPALQRLRNVTIHRSGDESIVCFSKRTTISEGGDDVVIVVVNVDPHGARDTTVKLTMPALGLDWHDTFVVDDEISGQSWRWGEQNYVRLDPAVECAHVLSIRRA